MSQPPLQLPFTAIVGQTLLKKALLLTVVDPRLGGVLISGPRGIAKTTLARGLAALLPEEAGPFVNLPLGCSSAQLTGSLDIEHALGKQQVRFCPGLLAKAHRGILYVDEINLLPDVLVDQLLDTTATGTHYIERDGISHSHPARFILIGSMNADEGELRPQLSDRFGLAVQIDSQPRRDERIAIVRMRRAFDLDPASVHEAEEKSMAMLKCRLAQARQQLTRIELPTWLEYHIADQCLAAGVEGVRADLAWQRAAMAHAAFEQRFEVNRQDVEAVASLVLSHRRKDPPSAAFAPPPSSGAPPPAFPSSSVSGSTSSNAQPGDTALPTAQDDTQKANTNDGYQGKAIAGSTTSRLWAPSASGGFSCAFDSETTRKTPVSLPSELIARGPVGSGSQQRPGLGHGSSADIDWTATLALNVNRRHRSLRRLQYHPSQSTSDHVVLIMLDASASLRHHAIFDAAVNAAYQLIEQARQQRCLIALHYFQGTHVKWLARGEKRPPDLYHALAKLQPTGGTPLGEALRQGLQWLKRWQHTHPNGIVESWLITDARCPLPALSPWPAPLTVLDSEQDACRLNRGKRLASLLEGQHRALSVTSARQHHMHTER